MKWIKNGKFVPEALQFFTDRSLHILNYNSPGATGAPAYTKMVMESLREAARLGVLTARREIPRDAFV